MAHAVVSLVTDTIIAFGPSLGYAVQLRNVVEGTEGIDGYSLPVSYVLIACHVLRLQYFAAQKLTQRPTYATALLFQSLIALATQLALIVVVLRKAISDRYTSVGEKTKTHERIAQHFPLPREFVARLVMFLAASCFFSMPACLGQMHPDILGFAALGIEAMLILPQLRLNWQRRSTAGVSWLLIFSWVGGDVVKMIYFIAKSQPMPFIACTTVQLCFDTILIYQLCSYHRDDSSRT